MNDIRELLEIISSLGGTASIDEIVSAYAKKYKMPASLVSKSVISSTLLNYKGNIRLNHANNKWENTTSSDEYLTVDQMKYFKSNIDAMKKIFGQSVSSYKGFFDVKDSDYSAWFPHFNHPDWINNYSEDGKFVSYKPRNKSFDFDEDEKKRCIFIKDKGGAKCRFIGVFEYLGENEDGFRVFKIIDDKIKIVGSYRPTLICRLAYMKYYDGITNDDIPVNGGSFVSENSDAFEKNNFHLYDDGNCYGFVETNYLPGHTSEHAFAQSILIENIDDSAKKQESISGVRVVFVALSPILNKTVVVGWYDDATVYRKRVIESEKFAYNIKCNGGNAHLISAVDRTFEVPKGKTDFPGIGQKNYWYIQNDERAAEFEEELQNYIDSLL